ncbi:MAG TPA: hypothetical protein VIL37_17255 [Natronosporangium sp.]
MARGMMPRPPSNPGRAQPPRRGAPTGGQRTTQRIAPLRGPGAEQLRQQQAEAQRQAAARAAQQQHRLRQAQFMREAQRVRLREEAQRRTERIREQEQRLGSILATGLGRSARIDLDALRQQQPELPAFDPGPLGTPAPEPVEEDFVARGIAGMLGGKGRKERQAAAAREAFEQAHAEWEAAEQQRREKLAEARRAHEAKLAEQREQAERYRVRIDRIATGLRERDSAAIESFLRTVLRRVPLPKAFPRRAEVTHLPVPELARIRMVLPDREIIPDVAGYEFAPPDQLRAVPRPAEEIDELYRLVLAQAALLVVRDVFEAEEQLDQVEFHGLVDRPDPATGEPGFAPVVTLDVSRDEFAAVDLAQTPPAEAAARLGADFAADLAASQPV